MGVLSQYLYHMIVGECKEMFEELVRHQCHMDLIINSGNMVFVVTLMTSKDVLPHHHQLEINACSHTHYLHYLNPDLMRHTLSWHCWNISFNWLVSFNRSESKCPAHGTIPKYILILKSYIIHNQAVYINAESKWRAKIACVCLKSRENANSHTEYFLITSIQPNKNPTSDSDFDSFCGRSMMWHVHKIKHCHVLY